jgi:D-glycero-D-manno-heptose 1,7-bisphosphate phosphatase
MMPKRYVLLDRDGTINVEREYLSDPDQVELLHHAARGIQEMGRLGLGVVVVTNQSGIGRGFFDLDRLAAIHQRLGELLAAEGARLDDIVYCPHLPDEGCGCRKPLPGLVEEAARRHGFSADEAYLVGDKPCDVELGRAIGATTFLVRTGYGWRHALDATVEPHYVADDLWQAARIMAELTVRGL